MANEPIKQSQLSVQADTRGNILSFHAGQATKVQTESGHHYTLRRVIHADDPTALEVPDNVIASRQGDALHLRYADGSTITHYHHYQLCRQRGHRSRHRKLQLWHHYGRHHAGVERNRQHITDWYRCRANL